MSIAFSVMRVLGEGETVESIESESGYEFQESDPDVKYTAFLGAVFIFMVILLHIVNMFVICLKPETIEKIPFINIVLGVALLGDVKDLKQGGQYKVNEMVNNALDMHSMETDKNRVLSTHYAKGLHNYAASRDKTETVGGLAWSWRQIISNDMSKKHGIWFYDRLIASNITQYIICVFVLLFGIALTNEAGVNFNPENARETMSAYTDVALNLTSHSSVTDEIMFEITDTMGGFIQNFTLGNGVGLTTLCPSSNLLAITNGVIDIASSNGTGQLSPFDAMCAFVELSGNQALEDAAGLDMQLQLLDAAGIDLFSVEDQAKEVIDEATSDAIDNLYPAEKYM